jgi:hypothetical protein
MRYFFDTEFIENGQTIDLLSIGMVDENDRTIYLQNEDAKFDFASDWVWRNVFPHLIHFDMAGRRSCSEKSYCTGDTRTGRCYQENCFWASRSQIRDEVKAFLDPEKYGKPEIWGYYADYDWVAFCQLFGTMMQLPKGYPMYCRDLKQLLDMQGNPRFQKESPHHALADAQWIRETWISLQHDKPTL